MADLTGTTPAATYKGLLQINDYTDGIAGNTGSNALAIQDGAGNATALAVSTDNVGIGTTNPEQLLHLKGQSPRIRLQDDSPVTDGIWDVNNNNSVFTLQYREGDGTNPVNRFHVLSNGNVGLGTASPAAPLEVSSTTGGVIMPRMTTTERNAIASPTNGEMVYDTDLNKFYGYANNAWTDLH